MELRDSARKVSQIVGHRGSSIDRPENTLASTLRAIEVGATAVEVDVRTSKDGQLVVRHDEQLERTSNGKGSVGEYTLAELQRLDAGSWFNPRFAGERIPNLEAVLRLCRGRIDVLLDLKESGVEYGQRVAALISKHGEEVRTIVGVRSVEQARQFRQILPRARQIGLIANPTEIEAYASAGVETIRLWPEWLVDGTLTGRVRKANVKLHLNGTKGDQDEVERLLRFGPDSLSSDDPGRLLDSLAQLLAGDLKVTLAPVQGEFQQSGLRAPVRIVRDRWGVAHIYAENQDDLFFAQGFVAAQDRLFQIDLWRRQAVGEMAEIMGPEAVEADRFARLIRYRGDMQAEWSSYSPDTLAIATAFTRGINACIDQFGENLPMEFQVLGYRPKKWSPEDVLGRSSGIYMTQNFRNEIQRMKLIRLIGMERARWLASVDPQPDYQLNLSADDVKNFPDNLLKGYEALTKNLSFVPPKTESNNWVVSGNRSKSGKPLLASDPHRAISLPSLRYVVHLNAPGWNVIGAGEPGLPGVALGHNEHIAWGFTIVGADNADLYVEELNPANPDEYAAGETFRPFTTYVEEIVVRGQSQPTRVTVKHTRHGPVLFEDPERRRAYALQWAGNEPGGAAYLASLAVDRARNVAEFKQALSRWRIPGLNFVYADVEGNSGWIAAARYPLREGQDKGHVGLLPVPGRGGFEWNQCLHVDQYPQEFNPKSGVLITANHNIHPADYPRAIGFEFAPRYRFQRLHELLSSKEKWDLGEFRALQQESGSVLARSLVQILSEVGAAPADQEAAVLLRNWDGNLSVDSSAASLFALWQKELSELILEQHVPKEHLKAVSSIIGWEGILRALQSDDNRWFSANGSSSRTEIVRQSFSRAVTAWKLLPAEQQQRWGALHKVTFTHPASSVGPAYARLLNIGPLERPGDANTPNNTRYDERFQQIHGASYRQLFDLADWDLGLATNAPGQSGQPGSSHYADLAEPWSRGEYFPLVYSRSKVEILAESTLILKPKP